MPAKVEEQKAPLPWREPPGRPWPGWLTLKVALLVLSMALFLASAAFILSGFIYPTPDRPPANTIDEVEAAMEADATREFWLGVCLNVLLLASVAVFLLSEDLLQNRRRRARSPNPATPTRSGEAPTPDRSLVSRSSFRPRPTAQGRFSTSVVSDLERRFRAIIDRTHGELAIRALLQTALRESRAEPPGTREVIQADLETLLALSQAKDASPEAEFPCGAGENAAYDALVSLVRKWPKLEVHRHLSFSLSGDFICNMFAKKSDWDKWATRDRVRDAVSVLFQKHAPLDPSDDAPLMRNVEPADRERWRRIFASAPQNRNRQIGPVTDPRLIAMRDALDRWVEFDGFPRLAIARFHLWPGLTWALPGTLGGRCTL